MRDVPRTYDRAFSNGTTHCHKLHGARAIRSDALALRLALTFHPCGDIRVPTKAEITSVSMAVGTVRFMLSPL